MASSVNDPEVLISVKNVSFSYGNTQVLIDVSFPIRSGDFLAILGPNGSGKTTLIKIILGLFKPTQGKIHLMRKPMQEFSDWEKIGYVPQKATHFDPNFPASVKEVVAMGLLSGKRSSRLSKKEEEKRIEQALTHVGMNEFQTWRIGTLSGGQQQRVFIARAIANKPRILFLDEPTTGVDIETQDQFYDMLDSLNKKEKITIVLISHEIGIVNKHITQVACLNQKLIYHGTHAEFCHSQAFQQMLSAGHHLISHRH